MNESASSPLCRSLPPGDECLAKFVLEEVEA